MLVLIAGAFGGMLVYTDVYDNIKSTIVDKVCFSCIKMDPISSLKFHCDTVNTQSHPNFILENLTKGPIFLAFRQDVCKACDDMEPIIKDFFEVDFTLKELFYQTLKYKENNITFYHINIDPPYEKESDSWYVYDIDQRGGVPMFVLITLGNCSGQIFPYYTTAYSNLNKDYLDNMITEGFKYYNEFKDKYNPSL
jgi:hypothetical protein